VCKKYCTRNSPVIWIIVQLTVFFNINDFNIDEHCKKQPPSLLLDAGLIIEVAVKPSLPFQTCLYIKLLTLFRMRVNN